MNYDKDVQATSRCERTGHGPKTEDPPPGAHLRQVLRGHSPHAGVLGSTRCWLLRGFVPTFPPTLGGQMEPSANHEAALSPFRGSFSSLHSPGDPAVVHLACGEGCSGLIILRRNH